MDMSVRGMGRADILFLCSLIDAVRNRRQGGEERWLMRGDDNGHPFFLKIEKECLESLLGFLIHPRERFIEQEQLCARKERSRDEDLLTLPSGKRLECSF